MEMRTKGEPKIAPDANQGARGIRKLSPRFTRPKPYGVQWTERVWNAAQNCEVRKTSSEFFPTAELCDARYRELCRDRRAGAAVQSSRQETAEWRAFQAAISGAKWQDVVAGWRAWQATNGGTAATITVAEAVTRHLARYSALVSKEQRSTASLRKITPHLNRFAAAFGHLDLARLKGEEIEAWIDELDDVESEATFNTYRRDIHALLEPFVTRRELRVNPCASVELRDELSETTGVLTIEETAVLLDTCLNYFDERNGWRFRPLLPRIVCEVFAGLRTSSAIRLEKTDVNFADRGITLPKRKLKTKRRHYVSGFPEVLWLWLAEAEERAWDPIPLREYRFLKSALFTAAGVPHPPNCLRHGFASYMMASRKNPGLVAYWLCHLNQQKLWDHYNGRVTEADGKRFEKLTPATAKKLATAFREKHLGEPPPVQS